MTQEDTDAISLSDFLRYTLRHWVLAVIIVAGSLLSTVLYMQISSAKYEACANIIVLGDTRQQGVERDIIIGNYIALITSNRVLEKVAEQTNLDIVHLRDFISAVRDKANEIITVNYVSGESDRAASVINSTIDSFQGAVSEMYGVPEDGVNVLSPPIDSGKPINKSLLLPMLMGGFGGIALAIVVAFVRFDLEQRKNSGKKFESDAEKKRHQRRVEKDAENIRKQRVAAELEEIETRKTEAKARHTEADLRIAEINLQKIDKQISQAEKRLAIAKKDELTAKTKTKEAQTKAELLEMEFRSTIDQINIKDEELIARRQSAARRRAAYLESRINSKADAQIVRIRANRRIEAEKSAKIDPPQTPDGSQVADSGQLDYGQNPETPRSGYRIKNSTVTGGKIIIKRPLSEGLR